jgi:hypothetical protein
VTTLQAPPTGVDLRKKIQQRWGALKTERTGWMSHWQELTTHILPRNGRYFSTDRNQAGAHHYNRIWDNTGTKSLRVLGAGMMAGATSPARPWFRLATADPDLNAFHDVKVWLEDSARRMLAVYAQSNVYRTLHGMYEELGCFGTSVCLLLPDFNSLIHAYPVPVGEFALAADYQARVNTLYREFQRSVIEVVQEFGRSNVSERTKHLYDEQNFEAPITILHAIEPRADRNPNMRDGRNMPIRSLYLEMGTEDNKVLRDSGFERFPVLAPRWAINTGDIYGHSAGMETLGDIRQLQQEQLRKGQAIDYQTKPPLQVPTAFKERDRQMFPGGVNFYDPGGIGLFDQNVPSSGIRTAFEVKLDLNALLIDIQDVRERIRSGFFADLFLMLANAGTNTRMTATEVAERHEEKLLMLGPTLERLHNELLEPLIDLTFDEMVRVGALLPPPEELQGQDLRVEFVSILAQAQRAIGTNSMDRFVGNLGAVAEFQPEVIDKFNADEWADRYSEMLGVDPNLIVPEERVRELREARNAAQAAQDQLAAMGQQAATAKDLAAAPTAGPQTALTDALDAVAGTAP